MLASRRPNLKQTTSGNANLPLEVKECIDLLKQAQKGIFIPGENKYNKLPENEVEEKQDLLKIILEQLNKINQKNNAFHHSQCTARYHFVYAALKYRLPFK